MTYFITASKNKSVCPYQTLIKELFLPTDRTNKSSTVFLEKVATIAIKAYLCKLEDPKKVMQKYISAFGSEFSYDHCSNKEKNATMGKMAVNDLAESSLAGVTAQLRVYRRVGMHGAAAVSDIGRNIFLDRGKATKKNKNTQTAATKGLFHDLCEELQLTAVMVAMQYAPRTRKLNDDALSFQREMKRKKDNLAKKKGVENSTDLFIESLIYYGMGESEACWKTLQDVVWGLKGLKYQKDQYQGLKDNILICYKGYGWAHWKTPWSHHGKLLSILELTSCLKKFIKMENQLKTPIPDKPKLILPTRAVMPILGQMTEQVIELDAKAAENTEDFERKARLEWKDRESNDTGNMDTPRHQLDAPDIRTLIGSRIEYLLEFDINEDGTKKDWRWCGGVDERVCDET